MALRLLLVCLLATPMAACATTSENKAKVGTGARADESAAVTGASSAETGFSFSWGEPVTVKVSEQVSKDEGSSRLTYLATLAPHRDGERLTLTLHDFDIEEINGEPIDTDEERAETAAMLAQIGAVPGLIISRQGRYEDVEGIDEMIAKVIAMQDGDEATRRSIEAVMNDPSTQQMLRKKVGEFWRAWVEAWLGHTLRPGQSRSFAFDEGTATVDYLSLDADQASMRMTYNADAAIIRAQTEQAMRSMMSRMGKDPQLLPPVQAVERATIIEATTDPRTLRPSKASMEQRNMVQIGGQEKRSFERHVYTFSWPSS